MTETIRGRSEQISANPEVTFEIGFELGSEMRGGEIVLLNGPLGAGKTVLAKGVAAGLGIDPDDVSSPSFTLVNTYQGRLTLHHIDLYRLSPGRTAAEAVDLDEVLREEEAVVLIEWGERLSSYRLPSGYRKITILGDGDDSRHITVELVNPYP